MSIVSSRPALALAAALVLAAGSQAQNSPLSAVPAKSPLVLHVRGLESAADRLSALAAQIQPGLDAKQMLLAPIMASPYGSRDASAIDKKGHVFVVFGSFSDFGGAQALTQAALVLPVTDYAAFKKTFFTEEEVASMKKDGKSDTVEMNGNTTYLMPTGGYVVACSNKDTLDLFTAKGEGLSKTLSKDVADSFLGTDGSVFVNFAEVNEQYGDQIATFKTLMELGLAQGGGNVDPKQAEMMRNFVDGLTQAIKDGSALVLGLDFRPSGLSLNFHFGLAKDSPTAESTAKFKAAPLADFLKLPGGQINHAAAKIDSPLRRFLSSAMSGSVPEDADDKVKAAAEEAGKLYDAAGVTETFSTLGAPLSTLEVTHAKDPAKALRAQLALIDLIGEGGQFSGTPIKGKPIVKRDAVTVNGVKFTYLEMELDLEKAVEGQQVPEQFKKMMEKMFEVMLPGGKTRSWVGATETEVITVGAQTPEQATKLIEGYLKQPMPVGNDPEFVKVRKALPPEANLIMILNAGKTAAHLVNGVSELAKAFEGGLPFEIPTVEIPEGKPGYIGAAIVIDEGGVKGDLLLTPGGIKQVAQTVGPVIAQARGGVQ